MIDLNHDERVVELVLNAPERLNALGACDLDEFTQRLGEAAELVAAREAGALLVRGEGRGFCAGRDISTVNPAEDDVLGYLEGKVEPVMRALAAFPAPTFAAVHGACLGVGLGVALACDVVYVAESAKLGSPFANLGATLDSGGHWLFTERLGTHRTLDLIYTGELMRGRDAVEQGLFSRWLPDDELLGFTRERAARAAAGATLAFNASKALVARIRDERIGLWTSMADENRAQAALCDTDDYREGFAAFQQKRRPTFHGR